MVAKSQQPQGGAVQCRFFTPQPGGFQEGRGEVNQGRCSLCGGRQRHGRPVQALRRRDQIPERRHQQCRIKGGLTMLNMDMRARSNAFSSLAG